MRYVDKDTVSEIFRFWWNYFADENEINMFAGKTYEYTKAAGGDPYPWDLFNLINEYIILESNTKLITIDQNGILSTKIDDLKVSVSKNTENGKIGYNFVHFDQPVEIKAWNGNFDIDTQAYLNSINLYSLENMYETLADKISKVTSNVIFLTKNENGNLINARFTLSIKYIDEKSVTYFDENYVINVFKDSGFLNPNNKEINSFIGNYVVTQGVFGSLPYTLHNNITAYVIGISKSYFVFDREDFSVGNIRVIPKDDINNDNISSVEYYDGGFGLNYFKYVMITFNRDVVIYGWTNSDIWAGDAFSSSSNQKINTFLNNSDARVKRIVFTSNFEDLKNSKFRLNFRPL